MDPQAEQAGLPLAIDGDRGFAVNAGGNHIDSVKSIYLASGNWDLLGCVAVRMVPGARIACNSHKIPFRIQVAA